MTCQSVAFARVCRVDPRATFGTLPVGLGIPTHYNVMVVCFRAKGRLEFDDHGAAPAEYSLIVKVKKPNEDQSHHFDMTSASARQSPQT